MPVDAVLTARPAQDPADQAAPASTRGPDPAPSHPRIRGFDGVRGLAVVAVIACHAWPEIFPGGSVGVQVFFVLSGYLITLLLLRQWSRSDRLGLGRFYLRRVLRLAPAMVVVAVATTALFLVVDRGAGRLVYAEVALLYLSNWVRAMGRPMGPLGHTWSLAMEEQFYLLWPLVAWFAWRRWQGVGVAVAAASGALLATGIAITLTLAGAGRTRIDNGFDTASAPLWIGCLCGVIAWHGARPILTRAVGAVTIPWLAVILFTRWGDHHVEVPLVHTATAVGIGCALPAISSGWGASILELPVLKRLGVISYGLYLWNYPITFIQGVQDLPGIIELPLVFGAALVLSEVTYRLLETPFLRLKERVAHAVR